MEQHIINSTADLESVVKNARPISELLLGEILLDEGHVTRPQLEHALQEQRQRPGRHLGEILIDLGTCTREQVTAALAHKLGIPYVRLGDYEIDTKVISLIPADIALHYNVLPLAIQNKHLTIAMENPMDWEALEVLRFNSNLTIDTVITSGQEISAALNKYYAEHPDEELEQIAEDIKIELPENENQEKETPLQLIEQQAKKKPVVRLVNAIIMQGIQHQASDINIRPEKNRVNIYYRIDGRLQFSRSFNKSLLPALVSRIKITGRMNIAERRLPQDGHARISHQGVSIDLRISCIPTITGESIVIRILDKRAGMKPLEKLGLADEELSTIRRLFSRSYGMFLVTGPTGSGKSITLYAALNEIKKREPHIITVEDPVEYDMEGVEQIQVQPITGYTFAEALRHILRHDPDVVMIGEIRDLETGRIANKAALTGHLVLSTLHTNDAASTVTRLLDMGIEPYLLSSTLLGVMAQRLVRLNCPHCKDEEKVDPEIRTVLKIPEDQHFHRGAGCESCNFTGYHGRAAVTELLEITPKLASLINNSASTQEIKEAALMDGMVPLTQNALSLAREGRTSLEEVFAVRLE